MRIILADDEPMALEVLARMLEAHGDVEIVGQYTDPLRAIADAPELKPDVALLDIEMGSMSGFELGSELSELLGDLSIVFVTAHSHYALEAFEINAIDYLLKPVQPKRLAESIERLRNRQAPSTERADVAEDLKLSVRSFGSFEVFAPDGKPVAWRTRKTKELFAYLWYNSERPAEKTEIMEALFGDKSFEQGTTLLHTTVYQLRNSLRSAGFSNSVLFADDSYRLNVAFTSDAEEMETLLDRNRHESADIERIFELYRGVFMKEGYPWLGHAQHRYSLNLYHTLTNYLEQLIAESGDTAFLEPSTRLLYELDPFSEDTAALVIRALGYRGRKRDIKWFYYHFVDNLRTEIGAEPSQKLTQLYESYL